MNVDDKHEKEVSKKLAKWEKYAVEEIRDKGEAESCQQLEVELLITENKQLRAQVALLTHEKETALAMWRNERKQCQGLSRLLMQERRNGNECRGAGRDKEDQAAHEGMAAENLNEWLAEGYSPTLDLHERAPVVREDEDQCLPTSSGRAALRVRGEISRPSAGRDASAQSPYSSAERKPPAEGSDSQPLLSKRDRRRKELFPQQLSHSPFPNGSKIMETKRRKIELTGPLPTPSTTRSGKGGKLQESRIPTPSLLAKGKLKPSLLEPPTTPLRSPGVSTSAETTPEGEAPTGPKDYTCRDCRRKFCRRGDRDNHEQLCGHTKWRNGKTLALGFVELD